MTSSFDLNLGFIYELAKCICDQALFAKCNKSDCLQLATLIHRVEGLLRDLEATTSVSGAAFSPLMRPLETALQAVVEGMVEARSVVEECCSKNRISALLFAGTIRTRLRQSTMLLTRAVQMLPLAILGMGAEQSRIIKRLELDLASACFDASSRAEQRSAELRAQMDHLMRAHKDTRPLLDDLLWKDAGGCTLTSQARADELQVLQHELERARANKEAQEERYIAQCIACINLHGGAGDVGSSGSSDSNYSNYSHGSCPAPVNPAVPDAFCCSITREPMTDPVLLIDSGHTYERDAIERWLARKKTDPNTNCPVSGQLAPNYALRQIIREWFDTYNKPQVPVPGRTATHSGDSYSRLHVQIRSTLVAPDSRGQSPFRVHLKHVAGPKIVGVDVDYNHTTFIPPVLSMRSSDGGVTWTVERPAWGVTAVHVTVKLAGGAQVRIVVPPNSGVNDYTVDE